MPAPSPPREAIGRIVGDENGSVVVELDSGERVACRGIRTLHRKQGFTTLPIGKRAKIRFSDKTARQPLLVELLE
jgi:hypothetical protein